MIRGLCPIIDYNLQKLNGERDGDLAPLKMAESLAGNAGLYEGKPCFAANCYIEPQTGGIRYFGNCQSIPEDITRKVKEMGCEEGTFRIALDLNGPEQIVEVRCGGLTRAAKVTLQNTVDAYNEIKRQEFAKREERKAG